MPSPLSGVEREAALAKIPEWQEVDGRDAIRRVLTFPDFRTAFAFMTEIALLAEKMDHHPEWLNIYREVDVTLASNDAGGVTERDIRLAIAIDKSMARMGGA